MIKSFLVSMISFIVLDFLWLGFVVKNFNTQQLAEIGRFQDGNLQLLYAPAFMTYILMSVALVYFVLPKITLETSSIMIFTWGALMGFIIYGVYDMTNLAVLKNYPVAFCASDISWGTFAFGAVTLLTYKATV